MPLHDHFHGWLKEDREWTSVHFQWCAVIAAELNKWLPPEFVAEVPCRLGIAVEADIAERQRVDPSATDSRNGAGGHGAGGVAVAARPVPATAPQLYEPPAADVELPGTFPDDLLVEVKNRSARWHVVGVVEVVSPANKKERSERDQFAAKCMSYLQRGIGLVVVDVVTASRRNLHDEMIRLAGYDPKFEFAGPTFTYAVSYRPVRRAERNLIDLWRWPLAVGAALPAVPLPLTGYGCVRLDLEATYSEACERCRIP